MSSKQRPKSVPNSDAEALAAGLYVVATPIGNAADITLRALSVLSSVDVVACEDTRVTARLLKIHGLKQPLIRYDDHAAAASRPVLIQRLLAGSRVALVSDAGTPLISDPGFRLVRACHETGIPVFTVPGPSSVMAALSVAGLPTDRFLFAGFPPARQGARRAVFAELAGVPATLVFMESPRRLAASLSDMAAAFGPRDAAVTRELTKLYEQVSRGSLDDLAERYAGAAAVKGEITVVVAPPGAPPPVSDADAERLLADALKTGSVRDAAGAVAAATGLPRRRLYERALQLSRRRR